MELPCISILTPTYKRRHFNALMINNVKSYDYPKDKLEWVIFDDSPIEHKQFKDEAEVLEVQKICGVKIRYIFDNSRHLTIGAKRNKLTKLAKYKICINQDTDDLYQHQYIKYSVSMLKSKKNAGLAGSPQMIFLFPNKDWLMTMIECPAERQIHEGCMIYTKKYFKSMGGFATKGTGEGSKLIDFSENRCIKTECKDQMVCIAHGSNTCNKDLFSEDKDSIYKLESKPNQFIKDVISKCLADEFIIV